MGFINTNPSAGGGTDTPTEILNKLITVDGDGSGIDADKLDGYDLSLGATPYTIVIRDASGNIPGGIPSSDSDTVDGLHASAFATAAQGILATNALPAASYTANDVLAKTKSVDGMGSGLDADLLDGYHASIGSTPYTIVLRDSTGSIVGVSSGGDADTLDGLDSTDFALVGHTHNYDATYVNVTGDTMTGILVAPVFQSTTPTGTSPIVVASRTKVTNFNADLLDGLESTDFSLDGHTHIGTNSAGVYESTTPTGTAPFVVASTTKVDNLNVDMVDNYHASLGSTPYTIVVRNALGNIDGVTGSGGDADTLDGLDSTDFALAGHIHTGTNIAPVFESTTPTGTSPFIVASTTKVQNLNADLLDGNEASAFAITGHTHDFDANFVNTTGDTMTGALIAPIFESTTPTGTMPFVVASQTKVTNLNADLLDGNEATAFAVTGHTHNYDSSYVNVTGDIMTGNLSVPVLESTTPTGTSPFVVASTTKVDNFNADLLDGYHASLGSTPNTIVVRNALGNIDGVTGNGGDADTLDGLNSTDFALVGHIHTGTNIADVFQSTTPTDSAPFIVASTTKVTNLNADLLDGNEASAFAVTGHTHDFDLNYVNTSGDIMTGNLSAPLFESTTPTGTMPFVVASQTKVTNLNADLLDGNEATAFATSGHTHDFDANFVNTSGDIMTGNLSAPLFESTTPTGTMPFIVASTTKVTNLNADLLDGNEATAFATSGHTHDFDANFVNTSGDTMTGGLTAPIFTSTTPTGTAPFVVTSTTKVTNLNAEYLDGLSSNLLQGFSMSIDQYYEQNTKLIDLCVNSAYTSKNGTQTADSTNVKIGTTALKIAASTNAVDYWYSDHLSIAPSLNLSTFNNYSSTSDTDYIYVVLYISDINAVSTGIDLYFDNSSNFAGTDGYEHTILAASLVTGWNYIKLLKSDFNIYGSGTWTGVQSIRLLWYSKINSLGAYVTFNLVQMIRKDPSLSIPNPFQINSIREFAINYGEWFVGFENGVMVCRDILPDTTIRYNAILGTELFNDFTAVLDAKSKTLANCSGLVFYIDATNYICAYISSNVLNFRKRIGAVIEEYSSNFTIVVGDRLRFVITKAGTKANLMVYLNDLITTTSSMEMDYALLTEGYLGLYSSNGVYQNIESLSISKNNKAYHATISDFATNSMLLDGLTSEDFIRTTTGGEGSAIDADKLDGMHSNEFATAAQGTLATNALPLSSYTASDVLAKVKSVDGSGSGLDADLLDGMETNEGSTPNTVVIRDTSGNIHLNSLTVQSTTNVANLNASLLNGYSYTAFASSAHTHNYDSSYVNVDGDAMTGNLSAPTFESTTPTGTMPFVVASRTLVTNLNADLLDGLEANAFSVIGHTHDFDSSFVNTTGDSMTGNLSAPVFESTTPTGTMPFVVASTTKVTNLNADLLDGNEATAFATSGHTHNYDANYVNVTGDTMTGNLSVPVFESTTPTGTAPMVVASTTMVENLNADLLDGNEATAFATSGHTHNYDSTYVNTSGDTMTGNLNIGATPVTEVPLYVYKNGQATIESYTTQTGNSSSSLKLSAPTQSWMIMNRGSQSNNLTITDFTTDIDTIVIKKTTGDVGICKTPSEKLDVNGSIKGYAFISTTPTDSAPLVVASETMVENLNADMLDGYDASQIQGFNMPIEQYYQQNTGTAIYPTNANSVSTWGTQSQDLVNVKVGTEALKVSENNNDVGTLLSCVQGLALDYTKFLDGSTCGTSDYICGAFYLSNYAQFTSVSIIFDKEVTYTGSDIYQYSITSLVAGWNFFKIAKSAFSVVGTPNWNSIGTIGLAAVTKINALGEYISFNYIQPVRKDPSTAIPNPFQRNGVADFAINSGEWFVGLESGVVVCRNINPVDSIYNNIVGTKAYTNFTLYAKYKTLTATHCIDGASWIIDTNNMVVGTIYANVLYLETKTAGGAWVAVTVACVVAVNDVLEFILKKSGTAVSLTVFKNGDYNAPYALQTTFTPTSAGYITNISNTGIYSNIQSLSITTTEHAEHSSIAEIANSLSTKVRDTDNTLAANSDLLVCSQKAIKAYIAGVVAGMFAEQADVAVTINSIAATPTTVLDLSVASTNYIVRDLRLKCVDPGANTVTVALSQLVNNVLTQVDTFVITTDNYTYDFSLMDLFGIPHIAGGNIKITVESSAGTYAITGQYAWAKAV